MKKLLKPYIIIDSARGILEVCLSYVLHKDDGWYLAECPELRLMDQGRTKRAAIENLFDMADASLSEAYQTKNIDAMLKELGFRKSTTQKRKKYISSNKAFENMHPLKLTVRLI